MARGIGFDGPRETPWGAVRPVFRCPGHPHRGAQFAVCTPLVRGWVRVLAGMWGGRFSPLQGGGVPLVRQCAPYGKRRA